MLTIILFKAASEQINQEDSFEAILQKEGFRVISIKTLDFEFENLVGLKGHLRNPNNFAGLLFSSPRCVSACSEALQDAKLPSEWTSKQNYGIGPTTVNAAQVLLQLSCNGSEAGDAEQLSKTILASKQSETALPLLYPHSNLARDTFKRQLGQAALLDIVVYKAIANKHLEEDLKNSLDNFQLVVDVAVYFSPSGVEAMHKLHQRMQHSQLKVIAIGPTTAQSLEKHNIYIFGICKKPTASSLLELLATI